MMKFCDYCTCRDCRKGREGLSHALTKDGRWICDCCYMYDICENRPCENLTCNHRPKIVGSWIEYRD